MPKGQDRGQGGLGGLAPRETQLPGGGDGGLGCSRTYTKPGQPLKCSAWGGGPRGAHGATRLVPGDGTRGCARAPGCRGMLQVSDL